jgi:hypothetical protein
MLTTIVERRSTISITHRQRQNSNTVRRVLRTFSRLSVLLSSQDSELNTGLISLIISCLNTHLFLLSLAFIAVAAGCADHVTDGRPVPPMQRQPSAGC